MVETRIDIPFDDTAGRRLRLALGACTLRVRPGADGAWVRGAYHDPTGDLALAVERDLGVVTLTQHRTVGGFMGLVHGIPACDLELGTARPYELIVETGGSDVALDLGGVPLEGLSIRAGAGKLVLDVTAPNPVDLGRVHVSMGAGALEAQRLGNLNAADVRIEGGATGMQIDLRGQWRCHGLVDVSAAMSGVELTVPCDRAMKITTSAVLGGVDLDPALTARDGAVWTAFAADGVVDVEVHAAVTFGGLKVLAR